ncbi:MAG: hypothetical protein IH857_06910 [Deltaproteobacteria bacterium]|nr:hypothetical protein [Deltaproteobacteria bacterium]
MSGKLNLMLAILLIGLAIFYPYLTKRSVAWQKMHPRIRTFLTVGFQLLATLCAAHALFSVLSDIEAITIATVDKIRPWIEGLILPVVVYLGAIMVLAGRWTKSHEEETLESKEKD